MTPPEQYTKNRKSVRLSKYDYSQAGSYFITICTHEKEPIFGEIINGVTHLNAIGQVAAAEWMRTTELRSEVDLNVWIVMPNHFHAIIEIPSSEEEITFPTGRSEQFGYAVPGSVATIIRAFKSAVTYQINSSRKSRGTRIWQRGFHDRIIRNETEYLTYYEYIQNNPMKWELDRQR